MGRDTAAGMREAALGTVTGPGANGVPTYGRHSTVMESIGTLVDVLASASITHVTGKTITLETAVGVGTARTIGTIVQSHEALVHLHAAVHIMLITRFADTLIAAR